MRYEAIALSPQFEKGRKSGSIEIRNDTVYFDNDSGVLLDLPLTGGSIKQGGTGNRYVYFTHPSKPDLTFYTDQKKILKHPDIHNNSELVKSAVKIKNNRRGLWFSVYTLGGILIASMTAFIFFRSTIVEYVATLVPPSWEHEVSETMLESAITGKNIVENHTIKSQLAKITTPLVRAVENKDFVFSFTIIEDPTLNAYALPGGAIVIHSGLIEQATDVNEVAGVLAHEISHVTRRHHIRGIVGKMGSFMLIRGIIGDITGLSGELIAIGSTLESLKYTRDYEREADDSGWELMLKANLDPRGMISFFEKLQHEHGDMEVASFMSTHPGTAERIQTLKEKSLANKSFDEIDINFEQFKTDINNYFANQ